MQVFVPYKNPLECAAVLDDRLLNKQIIECRQILAAVPPRAQYQRGPTEPDTPAHQRTRHGSVLWHNGRKTIGRLRHKRCVLYVACRFTTFGTKLIFNSQFSIFN